MTTVNKTSLIQSLETLIGNLTLSTIQKTRLVRLLKTTDNLQSTVSEIITQLQTDLNNISGSTDVETILVLILALTLITNDRMVSVASFSNLPATAPVGSIFYIVDQQAPVIKNSSGWIYLKESKMDTAWAWGQDTSGQLGDGTRVPNKTSPVSVVGGFTDWIQVSGGTNHSLGLRANGTAWAWGIGTDGPLGDGTIVDKSSPVSVVGGYTDWIQVSGGGAHSLGLRANGTAWAWGSGNVGRLGDGTVVSRSSPVSVIGGFTDWIQVSGSGHSLGLRANGTAWAWGSGANGRLGDGTIVDKSSPVSVVGGFTDWIQVDASGGHGLGLRANGTAWAWGSNGSGQLGDGTAVAKSSPVSVVGGFTDWIQINGSTGGGHSLGIRANGTAWAWGSGANGRLGNGTVVNRSSPVSVVGGFTDWIQVSGGSAHSVGLRANGTAWAWGLGTSGELGNGTLITRSSPVSVVGGFTDWIQVDAGNFHNLGLRAGK
jgi:alpha-tubulin suppressor-like RCC1 family protein